VYVTITLVSVAISQELRKSSLVLQNRAFQQVTPGTSAALAGWTAVNGSNITVVTDSVSSALPNALQVNIPSGTTGYSGFGTFRIIINFLAYSDSNGIVYS
jgi:hypothetical protein